MLPEVEPAEDLECSLGDRGDHAGSRGGLGGPVAHGQYTHTQVHTLKTHLRRGEGRGGEGRGGEPSIYICAVAITCTLVKDFHMLMSANHKLACMHPHTHTHTHTHTPTTHRHKVFTS